MKIAIEAERANNRIKTGVEHYAHQLIVHLSAIDAENEYILYLRTEPEEWIKKLPKNFSYKVMPFPIAWTQLRVSWEVLMRTPEVLFIPASSVPLIHPKKTIATVHDLAFLYYPETYSWFARNFHKLADFMTRMFTSKIIAVTESTKKDMIQEYGVKSKKITVVHHGYEHSVPEISGRTKQEPYVVFLATLQPRKNLPALIDAFRQLKQTHHELPEKLVVVGKPGWLFEPILKKIEDNKDIVEYKGHVSNEERLKVMRGASLMVLPSLYEGFGMQILEAFDAGVPVACSGISSMPEVAGEAAVLFDPTKTSEIKQAMEKVLLDENLQKELREKGYKRLKEFSWEKCARETLEVLTS